METFVQKVNNDLGNLGVQLKNFLSSNTSIRQTIFPGDSFFSTSGNHKFEEISADSVPIQDKLFKRSNEIFEIITFLLSGSTENHAKDFEKHKQVILSLILQNSLTWIKTTNEAANKAAEAVNSIQTLLSTLFKNSNLSPILVPDTNALYINADIENWNFSEFGTFEIIVTPSVLKDLDKHKIEHRNDSIRTKAITLINKLKEYRRRGKLTEGVVIKKDKINLRTIAVEPDFSKNLSWLDQNNEDDRLLAEILVLTKKNSDRPIFLITADINLQNKCEFIEFPFLEPPKTKS